MRKIFITLVFLGVFTGLKAQQLWGLTYNMSGFMNPALQDYISEMSTRGWGLDGRTLIDEHVSIGGFVGYQGFQEKVDRAVYHQNNTSISAVTWRYFFTIPIEVSMQYYFTKKGVRPYAGFGLGTYYVKQELQYSNLIVSEDKWNFGFTPQVGLLFPIRGTEWSAMVNAKYSYVVYRPDNFDVEKLAYWNIGLGIAYTPNFIYQK